MRELLVCLVFILIAGVSFSADSNQSGASGQMIVLQNTETNEAPTPPPPLPPTLEKKPDQPESYDVNYSYDPAGRRDPFASLIGGVKGRGKTAPAGALTVTDSTVVGITKSANGFTAIIMGSDRKARFMHVGDKLYDGEIIGIEADKVVFRQDITEELPTAPGLRSKEVVKR
ncbi:MAG: hypothetical protein C5B54_03425, partial [Acidobacteria bacterium]